MVDREIAVRASKSRLITQVSLGAGTAFNVADWHLDSLTQILKAKDADDLCTQYNSLSTS